jgi:hypothetical protein
MNVLASMRILDFGDLVKVGFFNPLRLIDVDEKRIPSDNLITWNPEARTFFH